MQPDAQTTGTRFGKFKRLPYRLDPSIPSLPETGFVRVPVVAKAIGQSDTAPFILAKKGRFPAPIKVSERVTCWRAEEVHAWLADPAGWQSAAGGV